MSGVIIASGMIKTVANPAGIRINTKNNNVSSRPKIFKGIVIDNYAGKRIGIDYYNVYVFQKKKIVKQVYEINLEIIENEEE